MKTTLEIPDAFFSQAKPAAAQQGIPLRQRQASSSESWIQKTVCDPRYERPLRLPFLSRDHHFDAVPGLRRLTLPYKPGLNAAIT